MSCGRSSRFSGPQPRRYILRKDRHIDGTFLALRGRIVFEYLRDDYGLAHHDTRASGIRHIAVTLDPEGGFPFFTVARNDLKDMP